MKANDTLDSKTRVYINHGWENMRISEPLSQDVTYQTYVKMQERGDRSYIGDAYIFNPSTDKIVAVYESVTFSAVPRKVLDKVLPHPAGGTSKPSVKVDSDPSRHAPPIAETYPILLQQPVQASMKPAPVNKDSGASLSANRLRAIIAEEVGVPSSDVQDDIGLADL